MTDTWTCSCKQVNWVTRDTCRACGKQWQHRQRGGLRPGVSARAGSPGTTQPWLLGCSPTCSMPCIPQQRTS
eukprot:1112780-Alexandrium_andersonii.AAC.1